ncbi:GAF domain-containing sensor histidine kinase [Paenibacillus profundus]|uniref:Oxygen sensor histidine kinase NreB n=1 Tax=Paenibacillus profundus TaxID=1173085 RepID=A0ABS8YCG6_9BACL|nr:GAF domain-containing sensor histidine kinase [Paenibacillus profundus]MCE5169713.1 GAF domain-containing sensor histidine kinase [Paenibacillus profundus]
MGSEIAIDELQAFKMIAETINRSTELPALLNNVLRTLVEITGLKAGWIFLIEEKSDYTLAADYQLPPALDADGKYHMKQGSCWCIDRYRKGKILQADNTLNCKRLEDAVKYRWGDTEGITHHATIPLHAGERLYGILNVAAPGKEQFHAKELMLLQSVAYQIGTAIERTLLYQSRLKRAELLNRLSGLSLSLGGVVDVKQIPEIVVRAVGEHLGCPAAAVYIAEGGKLSRHIKLENGKMSRRVQRSGSTALGPIWTAYAESKPHVWNEFHDRSDERPSSYRYMASQAAVPVLLRDKPIGVIHAGSTEQKHIDAVMMEMLQLVAEHMSRAYETAQYHEQQLHLLMWQERNRLARDLHDSVSQKLFALQLTARGMESLMSVPASSPGFQGESIMSVLTEMQELTKDAVCEMRSLIWQLRPAGLEEGLLTGLIRYGKTQGVLVIAHSEIMLELPRYLEETLFRIGQEALNNVRKHARTNTAHMRLYMEGGQVALEITDEGAGIVASELQQSAGVGITGMRERAEAYGGMFSMESGSRQGTLIRVMLPLKKEGNRYGD